MAACTLFGKVQTRRDFIAVSAPRAFLTTWESWLQPAVAASREALSERWRDAFLTAPIWRFWLGADIMGEACIGAIMPSMDGIGRYFPLTLACVAAPESTFLPPELDLQTDWFDAAEAFLLTTLETSDHDELLRLFAAVDPAPTIDCRRPVDGTAYLTGGEILLDPGGAGFDEAFARGREADPRRAFSSSTFWWTIGGGDYEPRAFASLRLPNSGTFAAMLTGDFKAEAAA